jgi:hypothetical protein
MPTNSNDGATSAHNMFICPCCGQSGPPFSECESCGEDSGMRYMPEDDEAGYVSRMFQNCREKISECDTYITAFPDEADYRSCNEKANYPNGNQEEARAIVSRLFQNCREKIDNTLAHKKIPEGYIDDEELEILDEFIDESESEENEKKATFKPIYGECATCGLIIRIGDKCTYCEETGVTRKVWNNWP